MILFRILFVFLLALPAAAQDRADRMVEAFVEWSETHGARSGTLTIVRLGEIVKTHGRRQSGDAPFPLASLSKSVTAACIASLVADKRLHYDRRLADIFAGENLDPATGAITLGALLTHTSGLGPDTTQGRMWRWLGSDRPRHVNIARTALPAPPGGTPGAYSYNNENYALLGRVIELVTNRTYADACASRVLTPLGITSARLSPDFGAFAAWGGWEMSGSDFARFLVAFAKQDTGAHPSTYLGEGAHYGLGTFWRDWRGGTNFWHFGAYCFGEEASNGAFYASWKGDWAVVASYDICADFDQMAALDLALSQAALAP